MEPVSIVMLAHNEAGVIEETVRSYHKEIIEKIPGSEFIIAEDGSTDGTKEILNRLEKELKIRVELGNERKGYTRAMLDGLKLAKNNIVFFSDSDGQHDPRDFWKLQENLDSYDIISGWKSHRKDGFLRVSVSWWMNSLLSVLFGQRVRDANSGFKLLRKKVIDNLNEEPIKMKLASAELMARAMKNGFKIHEVEVSHFERKFGASRGIPTSKIPGFMFETFFRLIELRFFR